MGFSRWIFSLVIRRLGSLIIKSYESWLFCFNSIKSWTKIENQIGDWKLSWGPEGIMKWECEDEITWLRGPRGNWQSVVIGAKIWGEGRPAELGTFSVAFGFLARCLSRSLSVPLSAVSVWFRPSCAGRHHSACLPAIDSALYVVHSPLFALLFLHGHHRHFLQPMPLIPNIRSCDSIISTPATHRQAHQFNFAL